MRPSRTSCRCAAFQTGSWVSARSNCCSVYRCSRRSAACASSDARAHSGSDSYWSWSARLAAKLNPSSRHVISSSRKASTCGEAPHHPSRLPSALAASFRDVQPAWETTSEKMRWAAMWPKCSQGERPDARVAVGLIASHRTGPGLRDELRETRVRGRGSAGEHGRWRHRVVDGQGRQAAGVAASSASVAAGHVLQHLGCDRGGAARQRLERTPHRELRQLRRQCLLHVAAERVRGRVDGARRAHRQQAVAVHGLEPAVQACRRGGEHAWQEEGRVVVGDDDRGVCGKTPEQALAGVRPRLDVGEVRHAQPPGSGPMLGHALQHEGMQAVAGPGVADAQRLEDQQGQVEIAAPTMPPVAGRSCPRAAGPRSSSRGRIVRAARRVGPQDSDARGGHTE